MNQSGKTTTITATELKMNLGHYLDSAIDGREIIITKNGKNAARLLPYIAAENELSSVNEEAVDYRVVYPDKKIKITYEEFLEIYEKSEARMEYINGELIMLSSPSVMHQGISGKLYLILTSFLKEKKCKAYYAPFDVHLYKPNCKAPDVVQPDLLIVCDIDEKVDEKGRYAGVPSLVIEILSPGTRTKDMVDKLNSYMLSGVNEFWIIDPDNKTVMVYGFKDLQIDDFKLYKPGESVKAYFFKGLEAGVNEIFN